jgi:hypothetical protein
MRTSFHHQPEAQHPNFQLSTRWQADYPIFWGKADITYIVEFRTAGGEALAISIPGRRDAEL